MVKKITGAGIPSPSEFAHAQEIPALGNNMQIQRPSNSNSSMTQNFNWKTLFEKLRHTQFFEMALLQTMTH